MTAVSEDVAADLKRRLAELEERLAAALTERDAAIERQTASALVSFRLQSEFRAAAERQHASAEILRAISESSGDAERSLTQIAETTARLFGAPSVTIRIAEGDEWIKTIRVGASSQASGAQPGSQSAAPGANLPATVYQENRQIHIPDMDNLDPSMANWPLAATRDAGARTVSGTPLRRKDKAIGALIVYRDRLAPFTLEELALQQSFADQAVIAIENARLFDQTSQALDRQEAGAEILRTIAAAPNDAEHSLQQVVETTAKLFGASSVRIRLVKDGEWGSTYHVGRSSEAIMSAVPEAQARIGGRNLPGTVVAENRQIHIPDLDHIPPEMADWPGLPPARAAGARTVSGTPLRREGNTLGVLLIHRDHLQPFTGAELALQQSFADQAVIAIENARLFNETQEALERQTATADILKVIASSPSDVRPVFEAIAESANRLIGGFTTAVHPVTDNMVHLAAATHTDPESDAAFKAAFPMPRSEAPAVALIEHGETAQIADAEMADPQTRRLGRARGWRSVTFTPLMNRGVFIGFIGCTRRETGVLADHHVQLLRTFADQAVIAIENTRLFNETKEALERQTATADILKVIASSPSDVQPVFEAIAERARSLLGGFSSTVYRFIDGQVLLEAFTPTTPEADEVLTSTFPMPIARFAPFEIVQAGEVAQIPDTESLTGEILDIARARGFRSLLFAPLMNQGTTIGLIAVTRASAGAFAGHHVQLLKTFADQAVIAIENTRLFNEVQARTADLEESLQQQTATADVLKVISRSTFDLQAVLETLIKSAVDLSGANRGSIFLREGDFFPLKAASRTTPEFLQYWAANPAKAGRGSATSRVIASGKIEVIPDVLEDPEMQMSAGSLVRIRATLGVPMLRDNKVEGVLVLTRPEPGPFTKSQIDLVQTFADQAVIAVENVRLFDEAQARTRELAKSLDDLRTAQDRLIQTEKLASLGQLTAGIAHEIKNPLNFVNNFAALSAELTDELKDALKPAVLDETIRAEVDELTGLMKDNLAKVVQHGKRADSIVKNMLLHSREGSGDHRPADVNALVEESLNLAYHGARAEKPQFNVTLKRDFDPDAGMIEAFPQEITRVLLNLISNGFYAVAKRKAEDGDTSFEPVVSATTKGQGDHVEIRIRDNGTGIPPEVKEKMFNPFFTTKPAGEGTGLGLSMSHDIIVKQHGGTIDVDTLPGAFSEFTILLPRTSQFSDKTRGQT
jgi:two-component system NtrC family sensor kinase